MWITITDCCGLGFVCFLVVRRVKSWCCLGLH